MAALGVYAIVFVVITYVYWVLHHGTKEEKEKFKERELSILGIVIASFILYGFLLRQL